MGLSEVFWASGPLPLVARGKTPWQPGLRSLWVTSSCLSGMFTKQRDSLARRSQGAHSLGPLVGKEEMS